jgi:LCP family protein required for cell wall assembly
MTASSSLIALALTGLLVLLLWIRLPDDKTPIIMNSPPPAPSVVLPSGASPPPTPSGGGDTDPEPLPEYSRREGVYTFLIAGTNEGLTDTLMVATLDTVRGTCHVLSIPRDTVVARAPRTVKKVNSSYIQERNTWDDEPGIPQLKKEIATLIGFQPQYTVMVDYNAFIRLITAIDGIRFNVPVRMYVPAEGINLYAGEQDLNADQALQLVRFRDYRDGDYRRMQVQQEFLRVAGRKAFSNWTKIGEYIDIAERHVESDSIDWGNIIGVALEVRNIGVDNVVFNTLPTVTVHRPAEIAGVYYEMVLAEEALALINETINPFNNPIREELVEYMELTQRRG